MSKVEDFPSPEELADRLDLLPAIKSWAKETEAFAVALMLQGIAIPRWKVVLGRKHTQWNADVSADMLELMGVEDPLAAPVLASPAKVLKRLAKVDDEGELLNYVKSNLTYKPDGLPKAAPESDRREPVSQSAGDDFSE